MIVENALRRADSEDAPVHRAGATSADDTEARCVKGKRTVLISRPERRACGQSEGVNAYLREASDRVQSCAEIALQTTKKSRGKRERTIQFGQQDSCLNRLLAMALRREQLSARHAGGHRFESCIAHSPTPLTNAT
jgi:hypothetical protein